MTTRRQFLINCSTVAAVAGLNPSALVATPSGCADVALDRIDFGTFSECLNTTFHVSRPSAPPVSLELVAADSWQSSVPQTCEAEDASNEKFSLTFRGPADQRLRQDQHTFEHSNLGRFGMFIVPIISRDREYAYYEAVFNRPALGFLENGIV